MVVAAALIVAMLPVIADVAMGDGLGVRTGGRNCSDGALQPRADEPEVGGEVGGAISLLCERRDDMEASGLGALHGGEHLAVGAELEDRAGPRFARELRVHRLRGPNAARGGLLPFSEDRGE